MEVEEQDGLEQKPRNSTNAETVSLERLRPRGPLITSYLELLTSVIATTTRDYAACCSPSAAYGDYASMQYGLGHWRLA